MSRTTRRKSAPIPSWIINDWVKFDDGTWRSVKYEGKQLEKKLAYWHRCKHNYWQFPKKYTRQICEITHRAKARMELEKFKQNYEYEVIIPRKELLPWD